MYRAELALKKALAQAPFTYSVFSILTVCRATYYGTMLVDLSDHSRLSTTCYVPTYYLLYIGPARDRASWRLSHT